MKEIVLTEEQIHDICHRMGKQIAEDLKEEEKPPLFVCIMKGALYFMADLLKAIPLKVVEDYVHISSYVGTKSSGEVVVKKWLEVNPEGRTVVLVEDIIDTGLSMNFLVKKLKEECHPKRILIAALFSKEPARTHPIKIDYLGYELTENKFLLGYGLDYNGLGRNIPYVFVPTEKEIAEMDEILARSKDQK